MMKKLTISFDNEAAAQHFAIWLCESGEQEYWLWMEYREQKDKKENITALSFDYDFDKLKVTTKVGRLDDDKR